MADVKPRRQPHGLQVRTWLPQEVRQYTASEFKANILKYRKKPYKTIKAKQPKRYLKSNGYTLFLEGGDDSVYDTKRKWAFYMPELKKIYLYRKWRVEINEARKESKPMKNVRMEVALSVSDYWDQEPGADDDTEAAFDDAKTDTAGAIREAIAELKSVLKTTEFQLIIEDQCTAKFLEFDSSNVTHAAAYFDVTLHVPVHVARSIEQYQRLQDA